ncbi:hypothetical protein DPMN_128073 [Dreissena polymorpha]|uniref:Uncharacterized protein n=1 Tax=Dreissena polymorpha TaxID=45954 RepID=A0A9D4JZC9_DREPO|nr:hypothetical protein DPMN_128073 [Dreissena polymorpha]
MPYRRRKGRRFREATAALPVPGSRRALQWPSCPSAGIQTLKSTLFPSICENLRHLERSDRCFVLARRPDGAWDWMMDCCKRPLRFACVQDTKTTTTIQPPATTVTMPPRPTAPPTNDNAATSGDAHISNQVQKTPQP